MVAELIRLRLAELIPAKSPEVVQDEAEGYLCGSSVSLMFFPECVARVPVSLWGSGGRGVFA